MGTGSNASVNIVGAGLAGALLALMLARRGLRVTVYERRSDPRRDLTAGGRSINLALAARGIRALEHAGVLGAVRPLLLPMRGRMVHELSGTTALLPYGQRPHEVIHSVSRTALNRVLIEAAARHPQVGLHFEQACVGVDPGQDALQLRAASPQTLAATAAPAVDCGRDGYTVKLTPTIAADGAGSAVRASLDRAGRMQAREDPLDHDYKELTLPAHGGRHALPPDALHVWPRGGFMLIALPNIDGSFTATLFLPRTGRVSFAALTTDENVRQLFAQQFPDAAALMPDLLREFREHPQGRLSTVHVSPWRIGAQVLLLGDAAHAIVPFHGQGMNAAFEDCLLLDELLELHGDWSTAFAQFESQRRPDAEAIAQMAIENYGEMRDRVRDEKFVRQKQLALLLERRFPERFIPRYSMVMFHPEIGYREALRRGAVQQEILDALDARAPDPDKPDLRYADALIAARLPPLSA